MEAKKLFAVVGTDARQAAAGRVLERAGYAVGGAEQVALADYILLPLPLDAARTPLAELLRAAKPGGTGGKCDCLCPARRTACAGREPWSAGCRACPAGRAGSGL